MRDQILQIIQANPEYRVFGLRAHGGKVEGEYLENSYTVLDGVVTDEQMEGVCAINLRVNMFGEPEQLDEAIELIAAYQGLLMVIATNSTECYEGNDVGEVVMPDAVLIGQPLT